MSDIQSVLTTNLQFEEIISQLTQAPNGSKIENIDPLKEAIARKVQPLAANFTKDSLELFHRKSARGKAGSWDKIDFSFNQQAHAHSFITIIRDTGIEAKITQGRDKQYFHVDIPLEKLNMALSSFTPDRMPFVTSDTKPDEGHLDLLKNSIQAIAESPLEKLIPDDIALPLKEALLDKISFSQPKPAPQIYDVLLQSVNFFHRRNKIDISMNNPRMAQLILYHLNQSLPNANFMITKGRDPQYLHIDVPLALFTNDEFLRALRAGPELPKATAPASPRNPAPISQPVIQQSPSMPQSLEDALMQAHANPKNNYVSPRLTDNRADKRLKDSVINQKVAIAKFMNYREGSYSLDTSVFNQLQTGKIGYAPILAQGAGKITTQDIQLFQESAQIFIAADVESRIALDSYINKTSDRSVARVMPYNPLHVTDSRVIFSQCRLMLDSGFNPLESEVNVGVIDICAPEIANSRSRSSQHDDFLDQQHHFKIDPQSQLPLYQLDGERRYELLLKAADLSGTQVMVIPGLGEGVFAGEFSEEAARLHAIGLKNILDRDFGSYHNLKKIVMSYIRPHGDKLRPIFESVFKNDPRVMVTDKDMTGFAADVSKAGYRCTLAMAGHPTQKIGNGTHPNLLRNNLLKNTEGAAAQEETVTTMLGGTNIIGQDPHFNKGLATKNVVSIAMASKSVFK